ncbi:MAG: LytTR family DNA-binding domain-containing protein [Lachnospiraceae bacterium]|nr:LytTR family DNA-binding domain-containing protein [Lachnospiraceae bacterium]
MIFQIALCDNDAEDLKRLQSFCDLFLQAHPEMECVFESFSSSTELKQQCNCKKFDVFILDILMPELNGIELGREIRRNNPNTPILYTTTAREFAFEAYGIHAMFYLEKPVEFEQLEPALLAAIQYHNRKQKNKILVNTKDGTTTVDINEVSYIENVSRTAVYHLCNKEEIVSICNRKSFESSVEEACKNGNFIQSHKSFFVNMQYIKLIHQKELYLDSGEQIPISRNRYAQVKSAYLHFMTGDQDDV